MPNQQNPKVPAFQLIDGGKEDVPTFRVTHVTPVTAIDGRGNPCPAINVHVDGTNYVFIDDDSSILTARLIS